MKMMTKQEVIEQRAKVLGLSLEEAERSLAILFDDSPPRRGLGDIVESVLTAVGITKERVERWTRTAGKPGGCGCEARKQWLNAVGDRFRHAVRDWLLAFRDLYLGIGGDTAQ